MAGWGSQDRVRGAGCRSYVGGLGRPSALWSGGDESEHDAIGLVDGGGEKCVAFLVLLFRDAERGIRRVHVKNVRMDWRIWCLSRSWGVQVATGRLMESECMNQERGRKATPLSLSSVERLLSVVALGRWFLSETSSLGLSLRCDKLHEADVGSVSAVQ